MKRYLPLQILTIFLIQFVAHADPSSVIQIYLDPTGSDANHGTKEAPLATVHRASEKVRELRSAEPNKGMEVIFKEGYYELDKALTLSPEDSGTAKQPIVYRAEEGSEVILSGGRRVKSLWDQVEGQIWRTRLSSDTVVFRQLFAEGKRAPRARFPNASESNPFLYADSGDFDHVKIDPGLVKDDWGREPDAQINIVSAWRFFNQWNTVKSVDSAKGIINLKNSELHGEIKKGNWFYIEGVKSELDEPGEWYYDNSTKWLYYMARENTLLWRWSPFGFPSCYYGNDAW